MIGIRHYSFDLWLTLIKSDPAFKQERVRHFHRHYNTAGKSIEEITAVFRQVDLMCNAINEKTGGNIRAEEMYLMVISMINEGKLSFSGIDLELLYNDMDKLLFRHLPTVYSTETIDTLKAIRDKQNVTCNILSNTGFIKGSSLRRVLQELELASYFDFQLYSDELGMSKPNRRLFFELLRHIDEVQGMNIDLDAIVHVGDNPYADIDGARAIGLNGILINSNTATISSLIRS